MNPELNAKPVGFVAMLKAERAGFEALSKAQRGYALHWVRSNEQRKNRNGSIFAYWRGKRDLWKAAIRKAKEQRP